jgi:hypothetical protein
VTASGRRDRVVILNTRQLEPEILDDLQAGDPRAIQSRRDLQKINRVMGHAGIVARALRAVPARRLVELGTGDGTLLLRVARRLGRSTGTRAMLVDRRPSVSAATLDAFTTAGWQIEIVEADVFEWLSRPGPEIADMTIANLFLHHFSDGDLARLLGLAGEQTTRFVAYEPRRSRTGLAGVSLLRLIGCSEVTLHDGRLSVQAGFRDRELSALWPTGSEWRVTEGRRGLFTHAFAAERDERPTISARSGPVSPTSASASAPGAPPDAPSRPAVETASAGR